MRNLNAKQRKLLDKWYNENKDDIQNGIASFEWATCREFSVSFYEELEKINNTEILYNEVNRYIRKLAGY